MSNLLAEGDLLQFISMVVILTLVAVFTWVRKFIERAQQQKGKGEPIDVGKAVRGQLQKYMRAAGQLPPEAPAAPAPPPAPAPVQTDTRRAVGVAMPTQAIAVQDHPRRAVGAAMPKQAITVRKERRSLAAELTVKTVKKVHHSRFTPKDVKRAIVQAELLGPPLAMRKDYRLF